MMIELQPHPLKTSTQRAPVHHISPHQSGNAQSALSVSDQVPPKPYETSVPRVQQRLAHNQAVGPPAEEVQRSCQDVIHCPNKESDVLLLYLPVCP